LKKNEKKKERKKGKRKKLGKKILYVWGNSVLLTPFR
jgi:hypothetical protein